MEHSNAVKQHAINILVRREWEEERMSERFYVNSDTSARHSDINVVI